VKDKNTEFKKKNEPFGVLELALAYLILSKIILSTKYASL